MCDLLVLAFQTDVTRIATFMFGREGSEQKYRMVGVNEGHHTISHHQNKPANIDKITAINIYHIQQFAYLLGRLKSIPEGDGTLLDNCMVAYGSAHRRRQPPRRTTTCRCCWSAAAAARSRPAATSATRRRRRSTTSGWRCSTGSARRPSKLGDSTGVLTGLA